MPTSFSTALSATNRLAELQLDELVVGASDSLNEQIHGLINRNADGVNRSALSIRRDTDLLLTLGISDPFAAKAGSLAQVALELANAGRGMTMNAEEHQLSILERADVVSKSMAVVTRAEMLLGNAKKSNRDNINHALEQQIKVLNDLRMSSLSSNTITS